MTNQEFDIVSGISPARIMRSIGGRYTYCYLMRESARGALSAANKSGNPRRRAAAMRAINYFSREGAK